MSANEMCFGRRKAKFNTGVRTVADHSAVGLEDESGHGVSGDCRPPEPMHRHRFETKPNMLPAADQSQATCRGALEQLMVKRS